MPTFLSQPTQDADYPALLEELRRLGLQHRLSYRLQVGELLLQRFYGGDGLAYRQRAANKESSFRHFLEHCREELIDLDLSEHALRRAVVCKLAFETLPAPVREQLEYGHVLALTSVGDPTARAQLAKATVDGQWNVKALKGAIEQLKAGRWYDTQSDAPGVQPPPPAAPPAPKPQPGRLATQAEKLLETAQHWRAQFTAVAPAQWSQPQKQRIRSALAALKAQVEELEQGLD